MLAQKRNDKSTDGMKLKPVIFQDSSKPATGI